MLTTQSKRLLEQVFLDACHLHEKGKSANMQVRLATYDFPLEAYEVPLPIAPKKWLSFEMCPAGKSLGFYVSAGEMRAALEGIRFVLINIDMHSYISNRKASCLRISGTYQGTFVTCDLFMRKVKLGGD